jgi:succinoglycan biosynthesis transport protein ExoP
MKTNDTQKGIAISALLTALKRRKLYLLIPVLLLTPAVCFYAFSLPQQFRARALVGAQPLLPGQPALAERNDGGTAGAQEEMRAIRDTLLSPAVLAAVSREFKLTDAPPELSSGKAGEDLKSRIQIQLEGPDAFYVGFEGRNPNQVTDVTNRLAGLFVERTANLRGQQVEQQDNVLDEEVDRLHRQLDGQEYGLKTYKDKVSQELPERLATNLKAVENLQQQIQSRTDQITEAEARASSITEEMKALEKQGALQDEPPAKTASQVALDDLRIKLSQLRTKYTPAHPEIKRTEKEIQDLEAVSALPQSAAHQPSTAQMRYFALQAELKPIEPRIVNYRQERDSLQSQMQEYEQRVDASPGYETALSERTKDAAMLRARYEQLFAKQQEARLSQRSKTVDSGLTFKILEPATVPTEPYSPHSGRIILFGALASLAIGVIGVFVAERMDNTFETSEQLEKFTTIPILSSVPNISLIPARNKRNQTGQWSLLGTYHDISRERARLFQKHRLSVVTDPQSVASQQYGILALKAQEWMKQTGGRVLVVTSATGEEGKSVTALNLSFAMADILDGRVLLVDCDLRLPQVRERLGLAAEKGFTDLLTETGSDFSPYISRVGNLDVISAGSKPKNPVVLLAAPRTREIVKHLRETYQFIVLDSPPLVPIADSHVLAGLADGVMLVVRARKTRPELFQRAVESLGTANLMGVVLNDVEYAATPYAYAYHYYQKHYLGRS